MSLKTTCVPRPSVFAQDRRATVLSLDTFLKGQVRGKEFFDENYFTVGMQTLVDRAFRQLAGERSGSSVFQLSQAMGGGKTHSMIALGLLARDPDLRKRVLGKEDPAPGLGKCHVVGFNGRNTDAPGGIWGSLAEQLGKADQFAPYVSPLLKAPGPEAWRQLFGTEPTVVFLDELPPYLEYAVSVPVGNGDLGVVTTAALGNLFVAVADMDNVCLVLSDLAGANYTVGQAGLQSAFDRSVQGIRSESRRIAVPITPVNPNGDELYQILRKRLFEQVGDEAETRRVASAYRDALKQAADMGLTSTAPETLYQRLADAYPFHPDLRELVGKFKENEGFQQTRGVIRLMQMVVSNIWRSGKAEHEDLIHPYDIDLNNDELASEVRTINPSLSEAIAHDIAHEGDSESEQIDAANRNADATDAAKLILLASLSTTPGSIHGLQEYQLVDALQRPGRDLSAFQASVMDKLHTRAWYLHDSPDGRIYFKNQQNLAAKLRSTALSLHAEVVDRMLREHLADYFAPSLRDCYQNVAVLPPLDEVQIDQERVMLVIVRPGGQANALPISPDWQAWWDQQQYKNRVLFLSGSRDTYQRVVDSARQTRALQSIREDLEAEHTPSSDPQWKALDDLQTRVGLQFNAALKEAFDVLVYPSINNALRASGIDLAFAGNQSGEATIRKTLEGAQKFTTRTDDEAFRNKAESRLFGSSKVVLWADFKRNAAVNTTWPLHRPAALDDLRADCLRRDLWREEGNHVRRGPFPPPEPDVAIRTLSEEDEGDGRTFLKIEPLHAPAVVYETGDAEPTASSSPVPTPTRFEASGLSYSFRAIDPTDTARFSGVREWKARLRIKQQLHNRGDHYEVEFLALPKASGIKIRYTTDGSSPTSSGFAIYDGPIRVPVGCRVVQAMAVADAYGLNSEVARVAIPQKGEETRAVDPQIPATLKLRVKKDDNGAVWDFIEQLGKAGGVKLNDIALTAENASGAQTLDFAGSTDDGYTAADLKALAEKLVDTVGEGALRLTVSTFNFATGQGLLDWLRANQLPFEQNQVTQ